ncbi:hypothetical protein FE257_011160 [Aspergillus nanangensis]|uniref:NmrA-like domain-containing protein n=1 Tax=Aspergillus nanangensis TaxID=2582783 RepID=A0AAD4GSV5_ASPNN|nr:hypothetical protein FE257_011160 [Aspergillus nanangensis]
MSSSSSSPMQKILVIGAGELGTQVLTSLAHHPRLQHLSKTVLLRPSTIASTAPAKLQELARLRAQNINILPGDIVHDSEATLTHLFLPYDTIISCTGFVAGPGTQLKLTRAVLAANTPRYIPWQFGVDYDAIGRGSAQDLFDEQLDVRDLLRGEGNIATRWLIVATGMFTSFLFEPAFGVVDLERSAVCALGGWENRVTVTAPGDIGRWTAEIVAQEEFNNRVVFVAGDTVSYGQLAEVVERVTGHEVRRSARTVEAARQDLVEEPGNSLFKYQVVFGEGRGVAWDVDGTWNQQVGLRGVSVEEYLKQQIG